MKLRLGEKGVTVGRRARGDNVKRLPAAAAIALLAGAVALVPTGTSARHTAAACAPVTNIEAIIDDSSSMAGTDSNRLRVAALDLLISKPQNAKLMLGAVEFGTGASPLFTPKRIGSMAASMKSILARSVRGDNGSTNYNDALSLAMTENPSAQARIFLTDGGHNAGTYANGHRGGPPTFVIGLTIGPASTGNPAARRLQQIANETGGKYYPQQDASTLQATVNEINATFDCQRAPLQVVDTFTSQGQERPHSTAVSKTTSTVELTTTWTDPTNRFVVTVVGPGRATRTAGATYVVLRITKPPPGTLRFNVTAARLVTGSASVITQIARNRRSSGAPVVVSLESFVDRIERILRQSASGRQELGVALGAGFNCSISPRETARRVDRVVDNRQSILDQLRVLQAPTQQAENVVTIMERAFQESLEADRHYRDGFLASAANPRCPVSSNSSFERARRSDGRATAAKERFVAAFNPLARRVHRRTWAVTEF
jgi:von Willebrand factor type A domain